MSHLSKKIVSGIQPSGFLHLGNYLGVIKHWKRLVDENTSNSKTDILYFIADYHALTTKLSKEKKVSFISDSPDENLEKLSLTTLAYLLASGVDHNKCTIFLQSSIPFHTELQWILSCVTPNSWLNTMIQYKEKKIDSNGLYSYPILMASDVLLYKGTHVPVGKDQLQHLELMAKITERINKMCRKDIFVNPAAIYSSHAKVMSLSNASKKMSKSDQGGQDSIVYLSDSKEVINSKIISAKTDSLGTIKYDEVNRPEISNLISIYSNITGKSIEETEQLFESKTMYDFKTKIVEMLQIELSPISEKANRLIKHEQDLLLDVLREGEKTAYEIAKNTLEEVKEALKILKVPKLI